MLKKYAQHVQQSLDSILNKQEGKLSRAARLLANTIEQDGVIYLFGCEHSALMAEDNFNRVGGLGCICPISVPESILHEFTEKGSEKLEELANEILIRYPLEESDTIIIFSVSGIHELPIEIARLTKKMQTKVICVSSSAYANVDSFHSSGLRLKDFGRLFNVYYSF